MPTNDTEPRPKDVKRVATVVIPARYESTRFPGKVLADRTGRPLVAHAYQAALSSKTVHRVVVATESRKVLASVRGFGGECIMTSKAHSNGTSRVAEAAEMLGLPRDEVVVNVQADEPELDPRLIGLTVRSLISSGAAISTLACPFGPGEDPADPSRVKVVRRKDGAALLLRELIPHDRDGDAPLEARPLRHIGIYAYRVRFLQRYRQMAPTPLERSEKLEQLRALENGYAIAVAITPKATGAASVDTPEDYEAFVDRWKLHHGESP